MKNVICIRNPSLDRIRFNGMLVKKRVFEADEEKIKKYLVEKTKIG